jgi:DNA (cytosine-5)-methyltransferase 1
MVKYSCENCQSVFAQKGHLEAHKNRKRPCKKDNTIEALVEQKVKEALSKTNEEAVKIDTTKSPQMQSNTMDYSKKTREELIAICKEKSIKGYSGKKKDEIIKLLADTSNTSNTTPVPVKNEIVIETTTKSNSQKLNMIDLFAGTGAFTLAFQLTNNVNVVFGNDMVEHSKKIYDENFNHKLTLKNLNDIKVEDIPSHDILTGGFPCQPFSIAGLQEGFKDERSNVFWKILSIIDYHQPKCVILENVKNLVSHDETKTFTTIKENLQKRGYYVSYKVLNTAEITGIPQHRERIYIVCVKSKKVFDKFSLDFPKIEKKPVSNFLESSVPDKYYYTDKSTTWTLVKNNVVKKNTIYQYRRVYVRENKSSECPTLTANMGGGGHNVPIILDDKGIRKLTPRECFNFQGFPSSYKLPNLSDSNLYKLAGNAVSIPVVKLIANRIIPLLQED